MRNKFALLLTFFLIVTALIVFYQFNRQDLPESIPNKERANKKRNPSTLPSDVQNRRTDFNRRTGKIIYTKHARCRMGCRHIDTFEVRDILENGSINYGKSETDSRPDPKYALEGDTDDGQHVRIVFAPTDRGMVVITVIDLEKEWSCNCK